MIRAGTFIATVVLLSLVCVRAEASEELESLRFMAGAWADEGGQVVEYWLPPLRGLMVGLNRAPEGDGMPFFEYLRIEARPGGVFYIASPKGIGTTEFELTEHSKARAVFENPEHDFPQKLIYTREGDMLEAEVGGERNGEWSSFTLRWTLVN